MRAINISIGFERRLGRTVLIATFALLGAVYAQLCVAQKVNVKTFPSAAEASQAVFVAVNHKDEQALEAILGGGKDLASSSDEVEDKLEREQFSQKYQQMHRLVRESNGTTVLYIGAENWPFPIPLVSKNGAWYFDSKAGEQEVMFRRIGENEATAIRVCSAFSTARKQSETKGTSDDHSISQYAKSLVSATAANSDSTESSPFYGYYFRTLTGNSTAGTNSYVSGSKGTGDLVLVAYPAEYRSSGVKTFVVTQDGGLYEKDLGPKTKTVAPGMNQRSPNSGWHAVD